MAKRPKRDKAREHRITTEVLVEVHDDYECALGWYYYLEEKLSFPFLARCITKRAISPLKAGAEVEVLRMAPEEECGHEMFVMIKWDRKEGLGVPLSQLTVIHGNKKTKEAVEDWHYWVNQGHLF